MIVCSTSTQSVGCTFLDWSVHFLTGQAEFFNVLRGWTPLTHNPVTKLNAHGHEKNHPAGQTETQILLSRLSKLDALTSLYPLPIRFGQAAKKLNININQASQQQWDEVFEFQRTDYNQMLELCAKNNVKIIFVALEEHLSVYAKTVRSLDRLPFKNQPAQSVQHIHDDLDQVFFKDSVNTWNELGLTDIWDVRERYALNQDLIKWQPMSVDLNFDHYWINAQNLWYNGESEIPKIVQWLGLEIDPARFESWLPVYREWQQLQLDTLQFQYNYQHIVDSIVNNWSYSIDLTFEQEVIIQHCLIYQHGLNLKTWELKKFPNNTQDLHKLLEPNIHPV